MKLFLMAMLAFSFGSYAQNKTSNTLTFKGDHYALYNKCLSPITFCEITQQTYTSCGSVKNCYGLYVLPGDTFYINIEDKNQMETISADISFNGYFSPVYNFIFKPIDLNCEPQQALQIAIPLNAVSGSSFQIIAENVAYVSSPTNTASVPQPFNIFVAGQQPAFTFALSDFTTCAISNDVSVKDRKNNFQLIVVSPNPFCNQIEVSTENFHNNISYILTDCYGKHVKSGFIEKNGSGILLSDIAQGLYCISFYSDGRLIEKQKIICINSD